MLPSTPLKPSKLLSSNPCLFHPHKLQVSLGYGRQALDWKGLEVNDLAEPLQKLNNGIELTMITNRGVKVWPNGFDETLCTDHWRCHYEIPSEQAADKVYISDLLRKAISENIDIIKTENPYEFDGVKGTYGVAGV